MEEVFKRVRFRSVHLESCDLDEEVRLHLPIQSMRKYNIHPLLQGASALFDIIEYYESATHLNISHNKNIDTRGWQACCRMLTRVSKVQCILYQVFFLQLTHTFTLLY